MESLKENIKASEHIKTTINFGGFYNSIHDGNIEWACESFYGDDNGNCNWDTILDRVDFKQLRGVYIDLYCDLFSDWLKDAFEYLASEYESTEFQSDYDRASGYDVLYSEMN